MKNERPDEFKKICISEKKYSASDSEALIKQFSYEPSNWLLSAVFLGVTVAVGGALFISYFPNKFSSFSSLFKTMFTQIAKMKTNFHFKR